MAPEVRTSGRRHHFIYICILQSHACLSISWHAASNFSEYMIRRFFEPTNRRNTKTLSECNGAATVQFPHESLLIHTCFDIPYHPSGWLIYRASQSACSRCGDPLSASFGDYPCPNTVRLLRNTFLPFRKKCLAGVTMEVKAKRRRKTGAKYSKNACGTCR